MRFFIFSTICSAVAADALFEMLLMLKMLSLCWCVCVCVAKIISKQSNHSVYWIFVSNVTDLINEFDTQLYIFMQFQWHRINFKCIGRNIAKNGEKSFDSEKIGLLHWSNWNIEIRISNQIITFKMQIVHNDKSIIVFFYGNTKSEY